MYSFIAEYSKSPRPAQNLLKGRGSRWSPRRSICTHRTTSRGWDHLRYSDMDLVRCDRRCSDVRAYNRALDKHRQL